MPPGGFQVRWQDQGAGVVEAAWRGLCQRFTALIVGKCPE